MFVCVPPPRQVLNDMVARIEEREGPKRLGGGELNDAKVAELVKALAEAECVCTF